MIVRWPRWMAIMAVFPLTLCLATASARAAPPVCHDSMDATAKASIEALLRAKYGDAYKAFDIDHPGMVTLFGPGDMNVVQTATGATRVDPRRVTWTSIGRYKPARRGVPSEVIVALDLCSNQAIGLRTFPHDDGKPMREPRGVP